MDKQILKKHAIIARSKSYAPYSNFNVGATILLKNGTYIYGANIENASYGLSMCAERNAIYQALLNGYKKEDMLAMGLIAKSEKIVSPCGACRQVISELFPQNAPIFLWTTDGLETETTIDELLPLAFDKENL